MHEGRKSAVQHEYLTLQKYLKFSLNLLRKISSLIIEGMSFHQYLLLDFLYTHNIYV
jgi:hypothetical protein